ncbi:MAG TPA: YdeI/OmpD-associated family protein [Candidatus Binatia bacterium]|nr:YdeI/OmpD-associated family protein [Candidatus Binatia bacterium]
MATAKKRPRHKMPARIKAALSKRGVLKAYNARPAYQRNDYLGWIAQGKTDATQAKRTNQMLSELDRGGVYMGMKHGASAKKRTARKAKRAR